MADRSLLAKVVNIHHFLEGDRREALRERMTRDRAIGLRVAELNDARRILHWWQCLQASATPPDDRAEQSFGASLVRVRRWLSLAMVVAGVLTGGSICALALAYDGRFPVNLLTFAGLMLGLPTLLLLLTCVSMAWHQLGGAQGAPGNPALPRNSWLISVWEHFSGAPFYPDEAQANARGGFAYWQVLLFSQLFGCGFFLGAIGTLMVLVATSDLAFGWSTTLQLDAQWVFRALHTMAFPWAAWWPLAVPSLELVEASRFYRLGGGAVTSGPAILGAWWPFVMGSLLIWGLLPRLLMVMLCYWRARQATYRLLIDHREVQAVLDRMATPLLGLGETTEGVPAPAARDIPVGDVAQLSGSTVVVWNQAVDADYPANWADRGVWLSSRMSAQEVRLSLHKAAEPIRRCVLLVKAWEPPTLEVLDLVELLLSELDDAGRIVVVPVGLPDDEYQPALADLGIWSAALSKLEQSRIELAKPAAELLSRPFDER